MPKAWPVSVKS